MDREPTVFDRYLAKLINNRHFRGHKVCDCGNSTFIEFGLDQVCSHCFRHHRGVKEIGG